MLSLASGRWSACACSNGLLAQKQIRWLVKTVGVLVAVIGTTLLVGAREQRITPELRLLGIGSAAGLAGIDTIYVARQRIPPVYLLDAVVELLIVVAWCFVPRGDHSYEP